MDLLLPAIETELQKLIMIRRKQDVYVTPFENFMPTGTRPPCIGIIPGPVVRREQPGQAIDEDLYVRLVGHVIQEGSGKDSLCGTKGVYPLLNAAWGQLFTTRLDLSGYRLMRMGNDRASTMVRHENNVWLAKVVREVVYTIER